MSVFPGKFQIFEKLGALPSPPIPGPYILGLDSVACTMQSLSFFYLFFFFLALFRVPWVPEVFLACSGNFWCWPKADTSSAEAIKT